MNRYMSFDRHWKTLLWIGILIFSIVLFYEKDGYGQEESESPPVVENVQELLEEADASKHVGRTEELYRRVLELDSLNRHARNGLFDIANLYKRQMEEAEQKDNIDSARASYVRYKNLTQYVLKVLVQQLKYQGARLVKTESEGGKKAITMDILDDLIEILHKMKIIYEEYPKEHSQEFLQKLGERIEVTIQLRGRVLP